MQTEGAPTFQLTAQRVAAKLKPLHCNMFLCLAAKPKPLQYSSLVCIVAKLYLDHYKIVQHFATKPIRFKTVGISQCTML